MKCIYCSSSKAPSKEHIIPYALGGRFSSSEIICKDCNAYLGAHVDRHITDWQLSLIARNWFDLEGQGGGVPSYEIETEDGQVLTVKGQGVLRPKWRNIVSRRDGKDFIFSGMAPTEQAAREAIKNVIAKETKRARHQPTISESRVEVHVRREWKPLESEVVYNHRKQGRAIAKMALHYLATQLDRRFLLTRDFEPIIRFVRYGEHSKHPPLCQPAIPQEIEDAKPCIQHSLTLRCSHTLRSAICDVALFGVLRFSVVLSYSYEGPDLFRKLIEYPLEGRFEEGPISGISLIPARLLLNISDKERESRYDYLKNAVDTLVNWLNRYGLCHYIRETLPEVIEHVNSRTLSADRGVTKWLAAIVDELSDRSSPAALLHFLGEPAQIAAEILYTELQRQAPRTATTFDEIKESFARLVLIRLLVDTLSFIVHTPTE